LGTCRNVEIETRVADSKSYEMVSEFQIPDTGFIESAGKKFN